MTDIEWWDRLAIGNDTNDEEAQHGKREITVNLQEDLRQNIQRLEEEKARFEEENAKLKPELVNLTTEEFDGTTHILAMFPKWTKK